MEQERDLKLKGKQVWTDVSSVAAENKKVVYSGCFGVKNPLFP